MGNRAVITTRENFNNDGIGIYLHWNGGRDSVEAFLKYCEIKGYRAPDRDNYGWARLCQVIGNFFGGSNSIGIDKVSNLDCDNWDNGTYIIEGWEIVDRKYFEGLEQNEYDIDGMLNSTEKEQLGGYLTATEIETEKLSIGDMVYILDYDGIPEKFTVVGFGADEYRNGYNVKGIPYVNKYNGMGDYSFNVNNYIFDKKVKITVAKQVEDEEMDYENM